jgi:prepilin-type N-terminal cleavage/methylation domain-containing protein
MRLLVRSLGRPARRRGFTLMEMIVTALVSVVLGAGIWTLMRSGYDAQYIVQNENYVNTTTRQAIDSFADNLRGAQAFTACDGGSMTYTDNSGQSVRYWLSSGNLLKTVNGSPNGGTVVVANISAVAFVYWTWNGSAWVSATSSSTPSTVSAVDFSLTMSYNGASRKISGSVKLRQK